MNDSKKPIDGERPIGIKITFQNPDTGEERTISPDTALVFFADEIENDGTCTALYTGGLVLAKQDIPEHDKVRNRASLHAVLLDYFRERFNEIMHDKEHSKYAEQKNLLVEGKTRLPGNIRDLMQKHAKNGRNGLPPEDFFKIKPI